MAKSKHPSLFIRSNPLAPQLCPDLAKEIGLNESILLLQWEYWMRSDAEERDGHLWLRKTQREIHQFFPFWGAGSIHRILQSLVSKGYMVAGSFDTGPGRGAQWFRIDWERVGTLKSIRVDCSNLEQRLLHSDEKLLQSGASVLISTKEDNKSNNARAKSHKPTEPLFTIEEVQNSDVFPGLENELAVYGLDFEHVYTQWWRKYFRLGGIGRRPGTRNTARQYAECIRSYFETWSRRETAGNGNKRTEEPDYLPAYLHPPKQL